MHEKNCNTCNKYSFVGKTNYCSTIDGNPRWMSKAQCSYISIVGCANHSRPHTSSTEAPDEIEQRFTSKRQAWEQGYQDGQSSVQHDINLIEHAIRNKTLEKVRAYYQNLPEHQGSCPFDQMNDDECKRYECNCTICIMEHCIIFLRTKE